MKEIIITILITFWITCSVIYVLKDMARPFSSSRDFLVILNIIFAPYLLFSDISSEWKDNKHFRDRYK